MAQRSVNQKNTRAGETGAPESGPVDSAFGIPRLGRDDDEAADREKVPPKSHTETPGQQAATATEAAPDPRLAAPLHPNKPRYHEGLDSDREAESKKH